MLKKKTLSSTGAPASDPRPRPRLGSSTEAGEPLYRQAMRRSRSVADRRDLSDVPMPVRLAIWPATEADGSQQVVTHAGRNNLCAQVLSLKFESNAYRERIIGLESQMAIITEEVERLRREQGVLARREEKDPMRAVVGTLREDLNQVMKTHGNAPEALPGLTVDVEEILTRVNPRLERLEAVVHAKITVTQVVKDENEFPLREERSSDDDHRSSHSRKRNKSSCLLRKKGPKYKRLRPLPCTNPLYRKVLDFRYYRLKRGGKKRSGRETAKVKDHFTRLKIGLNDLVFDGKTHILVIEFFNRFVAETDTLEMRRVTSWPVVVQYLLRNYVISNAIRQAILDLRDVTQKRGKGEAEYSSRLDRMATRCGNVHSTEDKITLLTDGLDPTIKSLVAGFREKHEGTPFLELDQFGQAEGEADRAREVTRNNTKLVHSRESSFARHDNQSQHDAIHLKDYWHSSVPTEDLPHSESQEQESLMAMEDRRPVPPASMQPPERGFNNRKTGWLDTQIASRSQPRSAASHEALICYMCYGRHHLSSECTLPANDLVRVLTNYETLSEERTRVPAGTYSKVKGYLCYHPRRQSGAPVTKDIGEPQDN
ncbi:unnamed protein product [Agarophyton chilense]